MSSGVSEGETDLVSVIEVVGFCFAKRPLFHAKAPVLSTKIVPAKKICEVVNFMVVFQL